MRCACPDHDLGFTLVEMLVAISILAVMAVTAYRVLDSVLVTRSHVMEEYARWRAIARAVAWVEDDLDAIQPRPVRDASDQLAAALVGREDVTAFGAPAIALTRSGLFDAADLALPPQRVGYRLRDGVLERLTWPAPDQAVASAPTVTVLLPGVSRFGLRYRDTAGKWQAKWPPVGVPDGQGRANSQVVQSSALDGPLPTAVDMTIQLVSGEQIHRLIVIRTAATS